MEHVIKNGSLSVVLSSMGGELQSVRDHENTEYLWQGDPRYWRNRATNIFPYIGRLTNEAYTLYGNTYHMAIHGFAKCSEMEAEGQKSDCITFSLMDNAETRKIYPYSFLYRIRYSLHKNTLHTAYEVENRDNKTMYFGLGGHPGFNVPIESGLNFSDYYLAFHGSSKPIQVGMTGTCFVSGNDRPFVLTEDQCLLLDHSLFDNDAIILKEMPSSVSLRSRNGSKSVTVSYPQMKYLGLWHKPHSDAPYLCIEPWTSLPARQDMIEDLANQPDLVSLEAGKTYLNEWDITIG
ncbi:MAG: aldose 1-epimerase family protein [Clostridiaceae bacterium]